MDYPFTVGMARGDERGRWSDSYLAGHLLREVARDLLTLSLEGSLHGRSQDR